MHVRQEEEDVTSKMCIRGLGWGGELAEKSRVASYPGVSEGLESAKVSSPT